MFYDNALLSKTFVLLQGAMVEDRRLKKRHDMTGSQECRLWTIRAVINFFVLLCLGGAGYLIFYVTEVSVEV